MANDLPLDEECCTELVAGMAEMLAPVRPDGLREWLWLEIVLLFKDIFCIYY